MPPISRGKVTPATRAKEYIKAWVATQPVPPNPDDLVVGHLFDFTLFKAFTDSISELIAAGENITGVRVYHARSNRRGELPAEEVDLVFVPVGDDDEDYYNIYQRPGGEKGVAGITPVIISESTPCPNICSGKYKENLNCPPGRTK